MRIRILHIVLALFLLMVLPQVKAQTTSFDVKVDSANILIGEQATVTFSIEIDDEDLYEWPTFLDTISKLEIVELGELETKKSWGNLTLKQSLSVTSFDSGYYVIKPQLLVLNGDSLFSDPILIQVNTIDLAENKEFYNIKEPVEPPFVWKNYYTYIIVGLVILIVLVILFLRSGKAESVLPEIEKDTRTPLQRLRSKIEEIRTKKFWESKSDKEYYSVLTDSIRTYLEEAENIPALELTTYETKSEVFSLKWNNALKQNTIALLEEADFVKFAKATATLEQKVAHFDNVVLLLEQLEDEEIAISVETKTSNNE